VDICVIGEDWSEVESPEKDLRLVQVSVGTDAVWAVTHDGGVWFRKGVQGEISGVCEQLATGTGWVEMLSKMALVSVAPNDQVIILILYLCDKEILYIGYSCACVRAYMDISFSVYTHTNADMHFMRGFYVL